MDKESPRVVLITGAFSSPRLRYRVGPISEKGAVELKKVLPSKLFERAIMWYYHVS